MSKHAIATQLAVGQLVTGAPVVADDALAVIEQLNWSFGERVSEVLIVDDQVDEIGTSSGFVLRRKARVWIDPDGASIEVLVDATVPTASNSVTMRTTIGADSIDLTIDDTTSGTPQTGTLLTSSTGTGWQTVTLEINHATGSASDCTRDLWQIQISRIEAADMRDPEP